MHSKEMQTKLFGGAMAAWKGHWMFWFAALGVEAKEAGLGRGACG
jgi:hypothetical protein